DVSVVGKTYGYSLGINNALGGGANSSIEETDTTPLSNTTTVQAGQLTVAANGPSAQDVSKNTNDVVLMNFSITPQATVDVSKFTITVVGDGANLIASDIDNLDLIIDGVTVGTKAAVIVGDNVYTDVFTLIGGKTVQGKIIVDINNTAGGNETIAATIKDMTATANFVAKTSDGDTVTDIIPSGAITGKTMNVTSASLALNRASSPAGGQTYVKGTTDASVAGFAFTAGSASDVKVTSIKLTAYLDNDQLGFAAGDKDQTSGARGVMTSIGIYDGATLVAPKKILSIGTADITVTFDSLNLTIAKGTSKTLVAKTDLSTTLVSSNDDNIALTIAAAGDVIAEYGTGTNLAPTLTTNNNTPTIYQTVAGAGILTMALDASTPSANLAVAGAQGVIYAKAKLTSTKEAFKVSKLQVVNSANDSNFTAVTLEYKDAADAIKTVDGTLVAGVADFTFAAGSEIYVKKDASAIVTIKGNMNTITGGAVNAAASTLTAKRAVNFEAYGVSSGEKLTTAAGVDAAGSSMALYESVPTVAFAADTPSGTLIPSANTLVAKINVSANVGKDITLSATGVANNQLVLSISATGAGLALADETITVKDKNGNVLCTFATLNLGTDATYTCDFATRDLVVAAGTTETVSVYLDTTELATAGNSVQIWLDDNAAANLTWSISGNLANYATGDITLRGDKFGGSLVKP
ncbi:hypothetical protein KJ996_06515, partial [Patescibacteria group bacterium]|nr:hypothetical protein [Patescibacteria group bacterium]